MALGDSDGANPYQQLNDIASRRPGSEFHPSDVSWETLEAVCEDIHDDFESLFEEFTADTNLTRREAQVYLLKEAALTPERLSDNAVGVLLAVIDGKDKPITQGAINATLQKAKNKIDQAREMMWVSTTTSAEEELSHPRITWLEHQTLEDLRSRAREGDRTIDDVVSRLLDQTQSTVSLREVLAWLVEEKDIADIQLSKQFLEETESQTLQMTATLPLDQHSDGGTPEILTDVDRIRFDDREFRFHLTESEFGPGGVANAITLYASDNIRGMDPVSIDEGLDSLRGFLNNEQRRDPR